MKINKVIISMNIMLICFVLSLLLVLIAPEQKVIEGERIYSNFSNLCYYSSIFLFIFGVLIGFSILYHKIKNKRNNLPKSE